MKIKNTQLAGESSSLRGKSFEFAVRVLKLNKHLEKLKVYTVANQLVRSGDKPGRNGARGF